MKTVITKEKAIELMQPQTEYVHSFVNPNGMLMGCDISWVDFEKKLDAATTIEMAGEQAVKMNHPICLTIDGRYEFIGKG
jgi:hypothetical protein